MAPNRQTTGMTELCALAPLGLYGEQINWIAVITSVVISRRRWRRMPA